MAARNNVLRLKLFMNNILIEIYTEALLAATQTQRYLGNTFRFKLV